MEGNNNSKERNGSARKLPFFFKKFFLQIQKFIRKLWQGIRNLVKRIGTLLKKRSPLSPSKSKVIPPVQQEGRTQVFDTAKLRQVDAKESGRNVTQEKLSYGHLFKPRVKKPSFILGTIITTAKIVGLVFVLFLAALIGSIFGVANAYLGTTPELDLQEISSNALTSYIYDGNENLITTYSGMENREYATLEEIPDMLQKAVISVEDVRFYHHEGIDLKGLIVAFLSNLASTSTTTSGGSTITQQLIKNKLLTTEKSYKRKIQEASLALQLEKKYSKDQILEAYLNTIPLGGTIYGVKAAAKDFFGKDLNELSLKECACIAGVTQYPWLYNPRRAYYVTQKVDSLNARINVVLNDMYKAGYITKEQMEEAEKEDLVVLKESPSQTLYSMPHFVEYAVYDVVTHLLKARGLEDNTQNRSAIENELRTSGYSIYTTVDPAIQDTVQESLSTYTKYPKLSSKDSVVMQPNGDGTYTEVIQPQASAVVIDQSTGELKAIIGSRNLPTVKKSLNRAYQSRMPVGSSIKPLAVYGPAFDLGLGLGSIIENIPAAIAGWGTAKGYPTTSQGEYGPISVRNGIKSSLNIVAARTLMYHVGIENSYNYLLKLGISPEALNADGVGLALGTSGITTIEMAGAYACIANAGTYVEPLAFRQVVDSKGNVVLDANEVRDTHQVFKQSTAFMLVEALTTAVASGTGTAAKISGITTAGKTGTNEGNKGVYFSGITGYYVSTLWIGHDGYKSLPGAYGGSYAAPLWKTYMSKILDGKSDKAILSGKASDYGVVKYTVCGVSGKIPTDACYKDPYHPVVSDYFAKGAGPTKTCDMHVEINTCSVSGELAGQYCPAENLVSGVGVVIPKDSDYAKLSAEQLASIFPNLVSIEDDSTVVPDEHATTCTIHTYEWFLEQQLIASAKTEGTALITEVQNFIAEESWRLTDTQVTTLQSLISTLQAKMNTASPTSASIISATDTLRSTKSSIEANLPAISPSPSPSLSSSPSI